MLERYLVLAALLFAIGLYGTLSRRNIVAILISIELMFNGVNVALVAFSRYVTPAALRVARVNEATADAVVTGQAFATFIIVVAAAEVALGLALIIALFRNRDTTDVTEVSLLRR